MNDKRNRGIGDPRDALDTGGPQGPPPTSPPEKSGSGGAGVDLDRLAALIHDALKSGELAAHWDAYGCNDDAVAALDVLVARVRVLEAVAEAAGRVVGLKHDQSRADEGPNDIRWECNHDCRACALRAALAAAGGGDRHE